MNYSLLVSNKSLTEPDIIVNSLNQTFYFLQKRKFLSSIEKLLFFIEDYQKLMNVKQELLMQINKFDISIEANGFILINHKILIGVIFLDKISVWAYGVGL